MATRANLRTELSSIIDDTSDSKWTTTQKNYALNQAIRDAFPMAYDIAVVDGGTGLVTATGTLDYTPATLTGLKAEGILRLEMEPQLSSEPYTIVENYIFLNVGGTPTIRLIEDPPSGRKLRVTYRTTKSEFTQDSSTTDLPDNYMLYYTAYLLATNFIPKGPRTNVEAYQKIAPSWYKMGMDALRRNTAPPPATSARRPRGI